MSEKPLLLVVTDSEVSFGTLRAVLDSSYECRWARSYAAAHALLAAGQPPAAILLECNLIVVKGLDSVKVFENAWPQIPVVVIGPECNESDVMKLGAQDFIGAGNNTKLLIEGTIRRAALRHKVRRQYEPLKETLAESVRLMDTMRNVSDKLTRR